MSVNTPRQSLELERLLPEIKEVSDRRLHRQVVEVWQRCWHESSFERIEDVPVSPKIDSPHLPHNRAVAQAALALADIYGRQHSCAIDRDALAAAALLHDVSKLVEYAPGTDGVVRTQLADALPHPTYAVHVALEAGVRLPIVHAVLAHTPDSPVEPRTLEAAILRYVDQADVAALGGSRWRQKVVHYR